MKTIQNKITKIILATLLLLGFNQIILSQTVVETLEIAADEAVQVAGGTTIKNLIVNADKYSCGQLVVESGVIQVEQMTYRFKLLKDDWTLIAFPSNITNFMDAASSNLLAKGYRQNLSLTRAIQMKSFNYEEALSDRDVWKILTNGDIEGSKAYQVAISGSEIGESDIIDFYFNNLSLDFLNLEANAIVDVDLSGKALQPDYNISISAENAKANVINLTVYNNPSGQPHPVNYEEAVANSKLLFTEDNTAFRIVLPSNEAAKVVIMDKKMKKTIQGLEYISPAEIPVSLFKKGNYKLLLEYGGVIGIKDLKIK